MQAPDLQGIIAATVLPMTESYEPDHDALAAYMTWILEEGVHGVAINVDTGEGPHLTQAERLAVLETVTRIVDGRVPVVSGLGAGSTAAVVAAASELRAAGADALLVFPPSTFRGTPLSTEGPLRDHRSVGEGADVPLILFQLQDALGGVEFPDEVLVALASLPHVVAIKEATFDALRYKATVAALRRAGADITILTGNDNFIYDSFLLGAEGALIGFGTLAVREQVAMVAAHQAGDHAAAAALGARIQTLADVIFRPPVRDYRVRLKEALTRLGVIPRASIRPPLLPVDDAERAIIEAALVAAGLL